MLKKLFLISLLIFSLIGNCFAASEVDQQQTTSDASLHIDGATGDSEEWAQSFIPSGNITCTQVDLYNFIGGSPTDNTILRIETNSAGIPSGTLVHANATKTVASSSIVHNDWNAYIFTNTFSLSASTTYWIVLQRSGARDTLNYVGWGGWISGGVYADGVPKVKNSGTWESPAWTGDMRFKVYKEVADRRMIIFD